MTIAPKKPRKKHVVTRKDFMQVAVAVARIATGEDKKAEPESDAVKSGRKGGLIGGKARSEALTPERKAEIAKKAAEARWNPKE